MNATKKMILVPYIPQRPDREIEQLGKLDQEMVKILDNKGIPIFDKIQLYNQILNQYIEKNEIIENASKNVTNNYSIVQSDPVSNNNIKIEEHEKASDVLNRIEDIQKAKKKRKTNKFLELRKKVYSPIKTRAQRKNKKDTEFNFNIPNFDFTNQNFDINNSLANEDMNISGFNKLNDTNVHWENYK